MHVKYRATPRQAFPHSVVRPAGALDLGPSTANCIRSTLGAQGALVEAVMADL